MRDSQRKPKPSTPVRSAPLCSRGSNLSSSSPSSLVGGSLRSFHSCDARRMQSQAAGRTQVAAPSRGRQKGDSDCTCRSLDLFVALVVVAELVFQRGWAQSPGVANESGRPDAGPRLQLEFAIFLSPALGRVPQSRLCAAGAGAASYGRPKGPHWAAGPDEPGWFAHNSRKLVPIHLNERRLAGRADWRGRGIK
jgi:hypothetical protein